MKLLVLAIVIGVANPAHAQLARHVVVEHVTIEQVSAEIPGALVEPLSKPKPMEALPPSVTPLRVEQPKPVFRAHTADKLFWLHTSAFAGSVALDAWSTSRFLDYRRSHESLIGKETGICTEGNRSLGLTPSNGHLASYYAAWTGGEVAATYVIKRLTRHAKSHWVRESWRFPIAYLTTYHSYWGLHNLAVCK